MKQANLFGTLLIVMLTVGFLTAFLLGRAIKEGIQQNDILAEKQLMQRADQVKRKGYEIDQRPGEVCGYYYWKQNGTWYTDQYCVGQHGTIKVLPDSLTFFHRRMIEEVDKIADRKGYGGGDSGL